MKILSSLQAFNAMTKFLDCYYRHTPSDDLAVILGSMQFAMDNETADPAKWEDWIDSIGASESLTVAEAFNGMKKFLEFYADLISSDDLKILLTKLQLSKNNEILDPAIQEVWDKCVDESLSEPEGSRSYLVLYK